MNKDKEQAKKLIQDTFEQPFNKDRFAGFIRELLHQYTYKPFNYGKGRITDAFKEHIRSFSRIGKYDDGKNKIDILVINLEKETSLERARSMQRNFVAWYLNGSRGGEMKDAALVAYVSPEKKDWRFSLVKMDYTFQKTKSGKMKVKEEFTPARRWSFLVGESERSHTAQIQLVDILANDKKSPTLEDLENAFDIEVVTKEFFRKYRDLFIRTKEELDRIVKNDQKVREDFEEKGVNTVNFAKKLLGQIVFLYFLQKKGWFGVGRNNDWGTGSKHFLRELFEKKHTQYNNFYNDILEPLFYEALRTDRSHDDNYYSRFDCKIPFLNGGLFDPIGNYNWVQTDINLPDDLFSNTNRTKEGDTEDGILNVFDLYNFTVREDEPLEKEVAIDPELLGKAYEKFNAIRPDNFDEYLKALKSKKKGEESKFNKKFGVYYTPREIVHYMCQQSIICYLYTKAKEAKLNTSIDKSHLEVLIEVGEIISENESTSLIKQEKIKNGILKESKYTSDLPDSIKENAKIIDEWLRKVTVCDPAVGSGAFPLGMMIEIVRARNVLSVFLKEENRNDYEFKRRCIEYSLYGVDIDPGAVEIAKLRLWLSLVVDETDIKKIKPLPNLEYKIICGNSLLGFPYRTSGLEKIEYLKEQFLCETSPSEKNKLREKINHAIYDQFKNTQTTLGYKVTIDFKINFSEVFHDNGGFDIVIANPPYVQLQKMRGNPLHQAYKNQDFNVYDAYGDIYCLFYEKGMNILRKNGQLCFISSNKWMRAGYGKKLRQNFLKYNPEILIDLGPGIFESATVDTNIILIEKSNNQNKTLSGTIYKENNEIPDISSYLKKKGIKISSFSEGPWFIANKSEMNLKEKIEKAGKPLKDWDVKIYRGVVTGYNTAFIIDEAKRKELIAKDPKSEEIIKPVFRGRDIKRYSYVFAGKFIIIAKFGSHKYLHEIYPAIYNHLKEHEYKLKNRGQCKYTRANRDNESSDFPGQHHWLELDNNPKEQFLNQFTKYKIVWPRLMRIHKSKKVTFPRFSLLKPHEYVLDSLCFITGNKLKYILAILNSKYGEKFFRENIAILDKGGMQMRQQYVENILIPPITSENKPLVKTIEHLVENILLKKKEKISSDTSKLEKEIDQIIYILYDLNEEEIKIIEGKTK